MISAVAFVDLVLPANKGPDTNMVPAWPSRRANHLWEGIE